MDNEQQEINFEAEEIRDILIAISVVSKRLATKLENSKFKEETDNGEKEDGYSGGT